MNFSKTHATAFMLKGATSDLCCWDRKCGKFILGKLHFEYWHGGTRERTALLLFFLTKKGFNSHKVTFSEKVKSFDKSFAIRQKCHKNFRYSCNVLYVLSRKTKIEFRENCTKNFLHSPHVFSFFRTFLLKTTSSQICLLVCLSEKQTQKRRNFSNFSFRERKSIRFRERTTYLQTSFYYVPYHKRNTLSFIRW
jgi:hypothetical protein